MDEHDLINALSADVRPVSARLSERQLAGGLLAGCALSLIALLAVFGVQSGLGTGARGGPFLMKASYAVSLSGLGLLTLRTLARPGSDFTLSWTWLAAPIGFLALLATVQLALAPPSHWPLMALGASWRQCPLRIAAFAAPIFAALCWALRRQAPVRLRAAGATAGFVAGAAGALIYALACTETSAGFVLIWYSLGIAIATGVGALLGPRLLRW